MTEGPPESFNGSMQNLLNPVEDLVQVLKTPIKLAERSSLNRQETLLILHPAAVLR